ncbi:restriction endonuclease subunit S [Collinsella aerofaciens]|uniref:restriction endonuclease subunit S n=1 Tax=Collinsella aerofaciens TaxID=74426 RepID=UPI00232EEC24|nr:restriction endonuclease subunit S [Collinsella aerofaciens]
MTHVCLGDVAREIKQKVPVDQELPTVGLEHLDPGEVELAHWDEGVETTFTKAFSKGQVLFGRRRAYLRKAAVAPFDGICSGDITVIAPKDNLSPRLLPFIIQNDALFEHAVTNSAGSLSPRVKWQSLSQFEFELPSIAKQEDLADILWTAQETRSHYRQLLTACDDVVKSQFVEMFGDEKWGFKPLSECVDSIDTGKSMNCGEGPRGVGGFGVLKLSALSSGTFVASENKVISKDNFMSIKEVEKGDLLFARKNTPELVGTTVYVPNEVRGLMFPDLVFRMKPKDVNALYLLAYMRSDRGLDLIQGMAHGSAKSMVNIPKTQLARLPVPVPPLELQQEFADFVAQVDKSKFAVQKALDELNATTKKILNQELGLGNV